MTVADTDGAGVPDAEQPEAAESRLVNCSSLELVEVADGVALGVADGEVVAVADGELLVAADGEQVGEGDIDVDVEGDGVEPPPAAGLTTQRNDANPTALVVSVAATVTRLVPAVVGVPEIRPEELIDTPAGSPVAV